MDVVQNIQVNIKIHHNFFQFHQEHNHKFAFLYYYEQYFLEVELIHIIFLEVSIIIIKKKNN